MTIFLATTTTAPALVRLPVVAVAAPTGFATVDLRPQNSLTTNSARPDAAAPLGTNGRWL